MKKIRTIRIPFKGDWERQAFLESRRAMYAYNYGDEAKEPNGDVVKCSYCERVVVGPVVRVVEFGEKVACEGCFGARFRKLKNRFKHYPVPPDLNPEGAKEASNLEAESALKQAAKIQDENVREVRGLGSVDGESPKSRD